MKLHIGDIVKPREECYFSKYYFKIKDINEENRSYALEILDWCNDNMYHFNDNDLKNWHDCSLEFVASAKEIKRLNQNNPFDSETEIEKKLVNDCAKKDNIKNQINASNCLEISANTLNTGRFWNSVLKGPTIKEGGENMYKILEIYENKERDKVNNTYNEKIKSLIENDEIQKIIKEMENQVKTVAGEKADEYSFDYPGLYEERTEKAIKKLEKERDIKVKELRRKIIEIKALEDLAPNYEEKIKILRDYDIIDKKKNIIL